MTESRTDFTDAKKRSLNLNQHIAPKIQEFQIHTTPYERNFEISPILQNKAGYSRLAIKASPKSFSKAIVSTNDVDHRVENLLITPSTIKNNKYNKISHSVSQKNTAPKESKRMVSNSMVAPKSNDYEVRIRHSLNEESRLFQAMALSPKMIKNPNVQKQIPTPPTSTNSQNSVDESLFSRSHLIHYINKQNQVISKYSYNDSKIDFVKDKLEKNGFSNGLMLNNKQKNDDDTLSHAEFKKARKYV